MNRLFKELIRIVVVLVPIAIFGASYFILGKWPNYLFNDIDTECVYQLERQLFGITMSDGGIITPCEYFKIHHCALMDILSGIFYLSWVPLPIIYAIYLQIKKRSELALRFTSAFLLVNILGFIGYYIYPASPPWYVMEYGFTPVLNTPGNVAGFINFDSLVGYPLFHSIYSNNANVFAAIPSLHAAYNPIAVYYAMKQRNHYAWQILLIVVSVGIWFSAVYSYHHYIIDVLLGILTTILGIMLFEKCIMRIPVVKKLYSDIGRWLSKVA